MALNETATLVQGVPEGIRWVDIVLGGIIALASGSIGAILGAQVGAKKTAEYDRERAKAEERGRDQAAAYSVQLKLARIYSQASHLRDEIRADLDAAGRHHIRPSLAVLRFANELPVVHFTTEEQWRALRVGGSILANHIAILDDAHNGMAAAFTAFCNRRDEVFSKAEERRRDPALQPLPIDQVPPYNVAWEGLDANVFNVLNFAEDVRQKAWAALLATFEARQNLGESGQLKARDPDGNEVVFGEPDPALPPEDLDQDLKPD